MKQENCSCDICKEINNPMNFHNVKMWIGFAGVFLTGALAVKQSGWTLRDIIPMVIAGLLAVEHTYNGNSSTTTS